MPQFVAAATLLHIPDGFLNTLVSLVAWLLAAAILALALRQANERFDERLVPLAGVMAAFIFAGQMINFPVAGGTSGHLVGATLAFIVLGPSLGLLAMTAVIVLQALLFQDGGLIALGANVFNMAVVGVLLAWAVHSALRRLLGDKPWATIASGFASAWLSVVVASLVAAVELALSGPSPWRVVWPAMAGVHALIGIGEGLITVAVLAFLRATRPDLLTLRQVAAQGGAE